MSRKLTVKQKKAAYLLALGYNQVTVAFKAGIRRETVSRWKRIPEFMQAIEAHMHQEKELMHKRLELFSQKAIDVLWQELNDQHYSSKRVQVAIFALTRMALQPLCISHENTCSKVDSSARSTSLIDASTPSALSDVTPYSEMPHGTMPA